MSSHRIFITAAEVSGDSHASHLIQALRRRRPDLLIEGHGGPRMRNAGAMIHHETTANAAMGVSALGRVREMLRLLKWTRRHFRQSPPDLQICVDSPALNFHFAKIAHAAGTPVLYYVAPQLWAWREGRMTKLRRWVDRVACILPFEEAYFRAHGVNTTFVGHPLFDELRQHSPLTELTGPGETHAAPVVGLLAGSRKSEADKNFPRMLEVASHIIEAFPDVRFLLPTTAATHPVVTAHLRIRKDGERFEVRQDAFDEMVPRCDLAITVSGTATLHVALHRTPMIVVYHGSPLTWNLLGRWVINTRTYALVNLLAADPQLAASGRVTSEMHVVPEFIPWYGPTKPVADYAIDLLRHPRKLAAQRERLTNLAARLDAPGASDRVAEIALDMLDAKKPDPAMDANGRG